jgi:hypothetical protein
MFVNSGRAVDLVTEHLDAKFCDDLVFDVKVLDMRDWFEVRFSLYNMADGDRQCYTSATIDRVDETVVLTRGIEQFPACG